MKLPVNFGEKVRLPPAVAGTGYPYRISATDLDVNFAFCALDAPDGWIADSSVGSHQGRKLNVPPFPTDDGTYVLGIMNGAIRWIHTEEC